ncbi:MAG: D-glycero-beta-D-manno-heptose 1-phosphate adenylyltransferase [Candidatus Neomarinimicrobiota bacterium]
MHCDKKILNRTEAIARTTALKKAGKIVAFTNGCFDILHVGHADLLEKAKSLGDVLIVGVNSDESVRRLKGGNRPINSETDRAEMLAALESVDFVVIFPEDTPAEIIAEIRPQILVKGGDYHIGNIVGRETVESDNGRVVVVPLREGKSTTKLIEIMKEK